MRSRGCVPSGVPHVYCSLGLHPHEARLYNDELENYLRTHLHKPHVGGPRGDGFRFLLQPLGLQGSNEGLSKADGFWPRSINYLWKFTPVKLKGKHWRFSKSTRGEWGD